MSSDIRGVLASARQLRFAGRAHRFLTKEEYLAARKSCRFRDGRRGVSRPRRANMPELTARRATAAPVCAEPFDDAKTRAAVAIAC
jgi:hypothetical protein